MSNLCIQNGLVIDPKRDVRAKLNCIIRDGKVAEWTKSKDVPTDCEVLDAKGAVVCPGFIDLHTHFRDPGEEYKEDIATGSAAAVAGGFSAVVCMANTRPTNDNASITKYILDKAREANLARIYVVGAVSQGLKGETLSDMGELVDAGVVGFSDDGKTILNTLLMRRALEYARDFDKPVIVHCEDEYLSANTVMHEGAVSTRIGMAGRPAASEEIIIRRDIILSKLTGARLHVQHVSTKDGLDAIREAKAAKLPVTAEVTPHHLFLTDECVASFDSHFKVNPPLRPELDCSAMRKGLREGLFDAIATDHAPHAITDKHDMSFEQAACGMIGIECALPVCMQLVTDKVLTLPKLISYFTHKPAAVMDLPGGSLPIGAPADITIFDPEQQHIIRSADFKSKSRNCPYEGRKCVGRVLHTIVGGQKVYSYA